MPYPIAAARPHGGGPRSNLLDKLVAYWPLDDAGIGARRNVVVSGDSLANSNAATQGQGPAAYGSASKFVAASTQSLSMASNSRISASNQPIAISVWVMLLSKPSNNMQIVAKTDGTTNEYIIDWATATDRFRFIIKGGSTTTIVSWSAAPALSTWYHIVGQYDDVNNQISIQVNNGTAVTAAHSAGFNNSGKNFYVSLYPPNLNYWDGRIAQLGIWKASAGAGKILSAAQVTALYGGGRAPAFPFSSAPTLATINWTDGAGNPILRDATYNRRDPSRIIVSGGTYYVYYTRYANGGDPLVGSIYYASAPALHGPWTEQGEVVAHGGGGAWDEKGTCAPDIIEAAGVFYLFYRGNNLSNARSSLGVATASSPAGPFTKSGSNPVLQNSTDSGDGGTWDTVICDNAYPLLMTDGSWRLYYKGNTGGSARKYGYATATAGGFPATWTKALASNPIFPITSTATEWEDPNVVVVDGVYYLMGCHPTNQSAADFYKSQDGVTQWVVASDVPSVAVASMPAWANAEDHGFQWSLLNGALRPTYIVFHARDAGHLLGIGILDLA